jgi:hypothetical protein
MEWIWTADTGQKMSVSLKEEDWAKIAVLIGKTAEKLKEVKVPQNHKLGAPWEGAWKAGAWISAAEGTK